MLEARSVETFRKKLDFVKTNFSFVNRVFGSCCDHKSPEAVKLIALAREQIGYSEGTRSYDIFNNLRKTYVKFQSYKEKCHGYINNN